MQTLIKGTLGSTFKLAQSTDIMKQYLVAKSNQPVKVKAKANYYPVRENKKDQCDMICQLLPDILRKYPADIF